MELQRAVSPLEAVKAIKSGDRVWLHGSSGTPTVLANAMVERAPELRDVEIAQILTCGPAPYADPKYSDSFRVNAHFISGNIRKAVNTNQNGSSFTPIMLHDIPHLMRSGEFPLDVAMIQVTAPDEHGFVSLGTNVVATREAVKQAKTVIAQVNPSYTRCLGEGATMHISEIDHFCVADTPLHAAPSSEASESQKAIAYHAAGLIHDGDCLQTGFGGVADAVLANLRDHKHLGVHTEMLSNSTVDLVECGAVTNMKKQTHVGQSVCSFALGTEKLYDFCDNNPSVQYHTVDYTNDPRNIAKNDNVVAINGAIEIDLTGQVNAMDMPNPKSEAGLTLWSGVGGQIDFMQGAAWSKNGRPISALPAMTPKGKTRIVPRLTSGAGVITHRYLTHWVVTEHGAVNLWGKSLAQRAKALISIADPSVREELTREAKRLNLM